MTIFNAITLSLRMLARDFRAGELRILSAALVIAVASVTTVAFFADRVKQALTREASQLLGADLRVISDRPLPNEFEQEARRIGLSTVPVVKFPSMAQFGDDAMLAEIKAVAPGYPLRGEIRILERADQLGRPALKIPAPGSVWVDEKFLARSGAKPGASITLGLRQFTVQAIITEEPGSAVGFLSLGPRVTMNLGDLPGTGLIQPGSRVSYRLLVAGAASQVESFRTFALTRTGAGQRVENIREARPEIKAALERAERFMGLSSLAAVALAAVAVALAARRFLQRHLDACALMRCLGASQGLILRLYFQHFVMLGIAASAAGCIVGYLAQQGLAALLSPLVQAQLPLPGLYPAIQGFGAGFVLLLGFALPPLIALGKVPTLRVLRRDLGVPRGFGVFGYALGIAAVAGLVLWEAEEAKLGGYVLGGLLGMILVSCLLSWVFLKFAARTGNTGGFAWRFGFANLRRRPLGSIIQVTALGLGIMALLVLTLVRSDLLQTWKTNLPAQAPNQFLVNILPDQLAPLSQYFVQNKVPQPGTFPMVKGRLVAINERKISSADYDDDRAKRLIDREFNLSWAAELQPDNVIISGRWWRADNTDKALLSVEEGIAQTLGIQMGDMLTYDIGGSLISARVENLRKVEWDSFRVNFFVIAPPGLLETYPVSYITSFYLPVERSGWMNQLVKSFPNVLVIDVAGILAQVQKTMAQAAQAVEFVFLFTLLAGLMVLYAAISATQDERIYDAAIFRALGANRRQMLHAQAAEFMVLGAMAGLFAAAGATALGYFLAIKFLNLTYSFDPWIWVIGLIAGCVGVTLAGLLGTRHTLRHSPLQTLRELG